MSTLISVAEVGQSVVEGCLACRVFRFGRWILYLYGLPRCEST